MFWSSIPHIDCYVEAYNISAILDIIEDEQLTCCMVFLC